MFLLYSGVLQEPVSQLLIGIDFCNFTNEMQFNDLEFPVMYTTHKETLYCGKGKCSDERRTPDLIVPGTCF